MKIAIVHDYLREYGGAERVVEALKKIYPDADVFVGFVDWQSLGSAAQRFKNWNIKTTWLQKIPGIKKIYSPLRILAPRAFADLEMGGYEVIISSSNAYFAKAVQKNRKMTTHLCYCHTPARSLYGYDTQSSQKKSWLVKNGGQLLNHYLRLTDFEVAQKVDVFMANSKIVRDRIEKFYRRESEVVYPPVGFVDAADEWLMKNKEQAQTLGKLKKQKDYFLYVNRLNFAKHPELAVEAAIKMDVSLKIIGSGPMEEELRALAQKAKNPNKIEFLGAVDDQKLMSAYAGAKAVIYPVIDEDFGMVPIEAMAWGTPVLAHRSGGPTETIVEGKTGLFFDELSVEAISEAMEKLRWRVFEPTVVRSYAYKYSAANFAKRITETIEKYHGST